MIDHAWSHLTSFHRIPEAVWEESPEVPYVREQGTAFAVKLVNKVYGLSKRNIQSLHQAVANSHR